MMHSPRMSETTVTRMPVRQSRRQLTLLFTSTNELACDLVGFGISDTSLVGYSSGKRITFDITLVAML